MELADLTIHAKICLQNRATARFCVIPVFWPRWALSWPESCIAVGCSSCCGCWCWASPGALLGALLAAWLSAGSWVAGCFGGWVAARAGIHSSTGYALDW